MQVQTARSAEAPKEMIETPTVTIISENVRPISETSEDGEIFIGYEWLETRFTPAETLAVRQGSTLGLTQQNSAMRRIYLRGRLSETDYVVAKIAEAEGEEAQALRQEYADVIAQRKAWRAELNRVVS